MHTENKWIRAALNAVSMITLPPAALTISVNQQDPFAWILFAIGFGVQVVKYHLEQKA